jgi:hypothetical protein
MMRDRQHRRSRRREQRIRTYPVIAPTGGSYISTLRERVLGWSFLDQLLSRVLEHPRVLQFAGILVGMVMISLTMHPLFWPTAPEHTSASSTASQRAGAEALPAPSDQPSPGDADVLNVVAAYNQASITAAVLGRADPMAPYLAPDGRTWAEVQAEYARRATRGEAHDPALTRWGVLRIAVDGDTATVETQEQWDDLTTVGGQVVSSKRGIMTRNTYTLRRSPGMGRWLITHVETTTILA